MLESLAAGQLGVARTLAERAVYLPTTLQQQFLSVIDTWNAQYSTILTQTSAAIEYGMRPLAASRQLAMDTQRQHEEAGQLAAASEQLAASVDEVASSARRSAASAKLVLEQVEQGMASIDEALHGIAQVSSDMETLRLRVDQMSEAVDPIQEVLALIRDISDQTNLLALNAAIEAARAGEQGRGFAVVASEVRRLAERTQTAVRDVQGKIRALQEGAALMGKAMDEVSARVMSGVALSENGRQALASTRSGLQQGAEPLLNIAAATDQQTAAVSVMADSTQEISQAAGDIGTAAADLAVMVDDLQQTLRSLRESVAGMHPQLSDRELLIASRADHLLWIQRLNRMLLGRETIAANEVADHTKCRLGLWYYGRGSELYESHPSFEALEEPHAQLHARAHAAVIAWQHGRKEEAQSLVAELGALSEQIVAGLDSLLQTMDAGS